MSNNQSSITKFRNGAAVLFIRADASSQIGTGHIMRCIALGQAWLDAGRHQAEGGGQGSGGRSQVSVCTPASVKFICAEIPDSLAERIKFEGFDLIRINAELGSSDDLNQTFNAIQSATEPEVSWAPRTRGNEVAIINRQSSITSPWLVLDGYHFNLDYQHGVRVAGHKLLLIDDYNHLPKYECDILLNQNINATDLDYHTNPEAKRLLGTQYALLRREFQSRTGFQPVRSDLKWRPSSQSLEPSAAAGDKKGRNFPDVAKKVLVTLGGADPDNATLRVIEALKQVNIPDLQVKVVVGSANPHIASLETVLQHSTSNIQLINSADMAELMAWADLAVSAASSTCWELCSLGVPLLSVILAENQVGLAGRLEKSGASKNMGWHYQLDVVGFAEEIRNLLNNEVLRNSLSCHALKLVDGRGSFRVVEIINGG